MLWKGKENSAGKKRTESMHRFPHHPYAMKKRDSPASAATGVPHRSGKRGGRIKGGTGPDVEGAAQDRVPERVRKRSSRDRATRQVRRLSVQSEHGVRSGGEHSRSKLAKERGKKEKCGVAVYGEEGGKKAGEKSRGGHLNAGNVAFI